MLKIKDLCKTYGSFQALNRLGFSIQEGEIFGFVGPNGAGKTTTMKIMAGLLTADAGSIMLNGEELLGNVSGLKQRIGYMPDFFGVYDNFKVTEYLEFYSSTYGIPEKTARERCMELLELVNLLDKADEYVDGLSRGMKQRLCLARTLVHNPDLLILDEPAAGLDPRTRYEFKYILKTLKEQGKTIIISSHILTELAEMCTSVGIIERGKIIMQGNIEEILDKVDASNPLIITIYKNRDRAIEILKKNRYIKTISVEDNQIMVGFVGRREEEAGLLKQLITEDVLVLAFRREQSSLESLFLKITGEGRESV